MKTRNNITGLTIHGASTKTVLSIAALLLLSGATSAVAQRVAPQVTRATVCVKVNGQMRMLTAAATVCDPSEQPMTWIVGGEVTAVQPGPGLVATREGGAISLALDPSYFDTCPSCGGGKVYAGFNDGPETIAVGEVPVVPIAALDVPEGHYAIFVKMVLTNLIYAKPPIVRCRLTAGADSDDAFVVIENPKGDDTIPQVMALQVVHQFETPGTVVVSCAASLGLVDDPLFSPAQFWHLKIVAIKASSISNVFLGGN